MTTHETERRRQPYDASKMEELILYVAQKCKRDPYFGAVKLNKILFYSDFASFARWGESITGAEYRKYERGPAPALMRSLKEGLEARGLAYEVLIQLSCTHQQKRLLPKREADLSKFKREHLDVVNGFIEALWGQTATQVSEESHRFPGWRLASMGEAIPYETVFLPIDPLPVSPDDMAWARSRVEKIRERPEALSA